MRCIRSSIGTAALFLCGVLAGSECMAQQPDTIEQPDTAVQADTTMVPEPGVQPPGAAPAGPTAEPVKIIMSKMHALNQMEMQAGQLAQEKGSEELVRNYGRRLFLDHRFADGKVTSLAQRKGVELVPLTQLPGEQQKMMQMKQKLDQLRQLQGDQFDKMFLQMMVQAHDMAIQTLNEALGMLEAPELSTLIRKLIPILDQHRSLAQLLQGGEQAANAATDRRIMP